MIRIGVGCLTLALNLFFCLMPSSCLRDARKESSGRFAKEEQYQVGKSGQGLVRFNTNGDWAVRVLTIPGASQMTHIQFNDQLAGWSANSRKIFRTSDGGNTWLTKEMSMLVPSFAFIEDAFFVTPSMGWVTFGTRLSPLKKEGHQTWIGHTIDQGKTLQNQFGKEGALIYRLRFVNDQFGWAIGRKKLIRETFEDRPFILRTIDGGKSWIDLSSRISSGSDFAIDLYAPERDVALLLTRRGHLYRTVDGGQSWTEDDYLAHEQAAIGMLRVGATPHKRLWVLGGADSREGMWARIAYKGEEETWTAYTTPNVYLKDLLFLSEREVLACGSALSIPNRNSVDNRRECVILYSQDAGRNWDILYKSDLAPILNSINTDPSNRVWAVGENGLVVRLDHSK